MSNYSSIPWDEIFNFCNDSFRFTTSSSYSKFLVNDTRLALIIHRRRNGGQRSTKTSSKQSEIRRIDGLNKINESGRNINVRSSESHRSETGIVLKLIYEPWHSITIARKDRVSRLNFSSAREEGWKVTSHAATLRMGNPRQFLHYNSLSLSLSFSFFFTLSVSLWQATKRRVTAPAVLITSPWWNSPRCLHYSGEALKFAGNGDKGSDGGDLVTITRFNIFNILSFFLFPFFFFLPCHNTQTLLFLTQKVESRKILTSAIIATAVKSITVPTTMNNRRQFELISWWSQSEASTLNRVRFFLFFFFFLETILRHVEQARNFFGENYENSNARRNIEKFFSWINLLWSWNFLLTSTWYFCRTLNIGTTLGNVNDFLNFCRSAPIIQSLIKWRKKVAQCVSKWR